MISNLKFCLFLALNLANASVLTAQWNNNPVINNLTVRTSQADVNPKSVTDGKNGSIIAFNKNDDIYAQKITSSGTVVWGDTINPAPVCNAANGQFLDNIIADGGGGAFIVWEDDRNNTGLAEIYLQHIDASGNALWAVNGIRVTNNSSNDYGAFLCSDGAGGLITGWNGDNMISNTQVYAQRYSAAGIALWQPNGIQVCSAPGFRNGNSIVIDGSSGAILLFIDTRDDPHGTDYTYFKNTTATNLNIYGQRLNSTGTLQWTANGVLVSGAPGNQNSIGLGYNTAVSDGSGGIIVVFDDERNDTPDVDGNPSNEDIYAQKINSNGVAQWGINGIPVSNSPGNQYMEAVVSDGNGGIVAAWDNEPNNLEFTQKINNKGVIGWAANGLLIDSITSFLSKIVNDGAGGYIYVFYNYINTVHSLRAQKFDSAGIHLWGATSVRIANDTYGLEGSSIPALTLADSASVIISWTDNRNSTSTGWDIFSAKLRSDGALAGNTVSPFTSIIDGDWSDPSIWANGKVPSATSVVIIRNNIVVTANTVCYSLTVQPPSGNLVVQTGVNLTVTH